MNKIDRLKKGGDDDGGGASSYRLYRTEEQCNKTVQTEREKIQKKREGNFSSIFDYTN
jgi:hypothetical protein